MRAVEKLKIKIFADGADLDAILRLYADPRIQGFTTNPTLMRKAGISDYESFGRKVLASVPNRPVSLEVFADDFPTMIAQGRAIKGWGKNVNIKIPVTNTKGEFAGDVIRTLAAEGAVLNITAITSVDQVRKVAACLNRDVAAIISVFAGRVADTGVDPVPMMAECRDVLRPYPKAELLWASPRELLNIFQADAVGCHIITVTPDLLDKLKLVGKSLDAYSLETVQMFHRDASQAGYSIAID